ncbi:condensation domain-containing protein [Pantoea ananatis]|nr:condensation domain-containing protein [Pantoea ananatis]
MPRRWRSAPSSGLRRLANALGMPVRTLLLTVHLRVLASLCGSQDVTTGLVVNVRPESADGDRVLGLFLNTLPLRVELAPGQWRALALRVRQAELGAIEHRNYPYFRLHQERGGEPLFETIFNYVNFHAYDALDGAAGFPGHEWTGYPLDVSFSHTGGRLLLQVIVDATRLSQAQAGCVAAYLRDAIAALIADPDAEHALHGDLYLRFDRGQAWWSNTATRCTDPPHTACGANRPGHALRLVQFRHFGRGTVPDHRRDHRVRPAALVTPDAAFEASAPVVGGGGRLGAMADLGDVRWLNTYGPTEATVYATAQALDCAAPPRAGDGIRVRVVCSSGVVCGDIVRWRDDGMVATRTSQAAWLSHRVGRDRGGTAGVSRPQRCGGGCA